MGKDNVRKLKNFEGKKSSKKYSKSKKSRRDPTTSDEMREILNSESENPNQNTFMAKNTNNKGLVPFEGDAPLARMPGMGMGMQNMGMGMPHPGMGMDMGMGMPHAGMDMGMGMPHPGMGMPNMGMQQMFSPANYDPIMLQQMAPLQTAQAMQQSGMPANLMTPSGMMSNMSGYAHAGAPAMPQFQMAQPSMPQQMAPQLPVMPMTGGGFNKISLPYKRKILTRTIL